MLYRVTLGTEENFIETTGFNHQPSFRINGQSNSAYLWNRLNYAIFILLYCLSVLVTEQEPTAVLPHRTTDQITGYLQAAAGIEPCGLEGFPGYLNLNRGGWILFAGAVWEGKQSLRTPQQQLWDPRKFERLANCWIERNLELCLEVSCLIPSAFRNTGLCSEYINTWNFHFQFLLL